MVPEAAPAGASAGFASAAGVGLLVPGLSCRAVSGLSWSRASAVPPTAVTIGHPATPVAATAAIVNTAAGVGWLPCSLGGSGGRAFHAAEQAADRGSAEGAEGGRRGLTCSAGHPGRIAHQIHDFSPHSPSPKLGAPDPDREYPNRRRLNGLAVRGFRGAPGA